MRKLHVLIQFGVFDRHSCRTLNGRAFIMIREQRRNLPPQVAVIAASMARIGFPVWPKYPN
jgi:hypothetical protein